MIFCNKYMTSTIIRFQEPGQKFTHKVMPAKLQLMSIACTWYLTLLIANIKQRRITFACSSSIEKWMDLLCKIRFQPKWTNGINDREPMFPLRYTNSRRKELSFSCTIPSLGVTWILWDFRIDKQDRDIYGPQRQAQSPDRFTGLLVC
jgi:hypothetical protein